jgi:hypothetical protein
MDGEPDLAKSCMDASKSFGDLEHPHIRAAMEANAALYPLIPLYDVLYTRGSGQLWYYGDMGNFIILVLCKRGVRQGGVMGTTILDIKVRLVYDALFELLRPEGIIFSYADDVYMGGVRVCVALALSVAPDLYNMVGLQL